MHEWFSTRSFGGAEKVVQAMDSCLRGIGIDPDLAALIDGVSSQSDSWMHGRLVKTSFLQNFPFSKTHIQQYLPFLPFAIEQLDLSKYSMVISSNHLVAKGALTSPDQLHISYVHTPVRYAWDQMNVYLQQSNLSKFGLGPFVRLQLHYLRLWDQLSSSRPNYLIANSRFTARRIAKFWRRKSLVIHPPVDVERFQWNLSRDDYYLCLSRLVPNKRVDLVVKAFTLLRLPLVVVGTGPEVRLIKSLAGSNVKVMGYQSHEQVARLMAHCRAFVYAGLEDFGIAPVEAMASGAPVIAFGRGGLLDTVRCGFSRDPSKATGIFFPEQTVSSLAEAVTWFEESAYWKQMSSESIRLWSERFRPEAFSRQFEKAISKMWNSHQNDSRFELTDAYESP